MDTFLTLLYFRGLFATMEEKEVASLKETLQHQDLLLQKLRVELEEEREASASAATEALSMILRLQAEKAAEKMEAWQYKRMAEEKMHHAEESLLIFEELLYQKELEISSLKFEVQDYVDKLSCVLSENNKTEEDTFESPSSRACCILSREKSFNRLARKNSSLPVLKIKELCSQMDSVDKDIALVRSAYSSPRYLDGSSKKFNKSSCPEKAAVLQTRLSIMSDKSAIGNCDCCFRRVEVTAEKVVEPYASSNEQEEALICISNETSTSTNERMEPDAEDRSLYFRGEHLDMPNSPYSKKTLLRTNTVTSVDTHDIFEVPRCHGALVEHPRQAAFKSNSEHKKKGVLSSCQGSRLNTPRKDHKGYFIDSEQLEKRLQKLEDESVRMHYEDLEGEERMNLLREMHEQLKTLQRYIGEQKEKKNSQDSASYVSLMEAMLSFSI